MKNWTKDRSLSLSICCVWIFAALLFAAFVWGYPLVRWYSTAVEPIKADARTAFLIALYGAGVFAWICLYCMLRLLRNMRAEKVFTDENVSLLRAVSWCCAGAAAVFLVCAVIYLPFIIPAVAAAFMMLIVRVVKNSFRQACDMKEELDLTI